MAEVWFYHFERGSLEDLLPPLLLRCLDRGWRVVLRAGGPERATALDDHLWTFDDTAFLPHGSDGDEHAADQPIWITSGEDTPNGAQAQILVDRATMAEPSGFERSMLVFDGRDGDALQAARQVWKQVRDAGHEASYWQMSGAGKWEKKA